ncbi:two-component system, OmpR family, response regulator [Sphingopyxis macrogoltabida]|nr:two-component system, OmpR family, response regulator [Sphingopyxis macrogoltabida]
MICPFNEVASVRSTLGFVAIWFGNAPLDKRLRPAQTRRVAVEPIPHLRGDVPVCVGKSERLVSAIANLGNMDQGPPDSARLRRMPDSRPGRELGGSRRSGFESDEGLRRSAEPFAVYRSLSSRRNTHAIAFTLIF